MCLPSCHTPPFPQAAEMQRAFVFPRSGVARPCTWQPNGLTRISLPCFWTNARARTRPRFWRTRTRYGGHAATDSFNPSTQWHAFQIVSAGCGASRRCTLVVHAHAAASPRAESTGGQIHAAAHGSFRLERCMLQGAPQKSRKRLRRRRDGNAPLPPRHQQSLERLRLIHA